jgi:hypothetical protein
VRGVAVGCRQNGCALLGGETAQLPGIYTPPDYDLAGFIVGYVAEERILVRGIEALTAAAGMPDATKGARFLLQLASSPGELLDWAEAERIKYLRCVLTDPVLIRAARFAVLGTVEEVAGGVG